MIEQTATGSAASGGRRRAALLGLLLGPALVTVAYGAAALSLAGKVPPGTRVAGIDIGGMEPAVAEATLHRALSGVAGQPLTAVVAGKRVQLEPAKIGLSTDVRGTVAAAREGTLTPDGILRSFFGRRDLAPRIAVDDELLTGAITGLAKTVDRPAREGGISYRGLQPRVTLPKNGRKLDTAAAAEAVRAAYQRLDASGQREVALPVQVVPPQVPATTIKKAATSTARDAVSAPLTVTHGPRKATVAREKIAAGLRFVPAGTNQLRPSFDADDVAAELQTTLIPKAQAPKDASFRIVGGRPRVVPSRPGRGIDAETFGRSVVAALTRGGSRTVTAPITTGTPRLSTEEARKLGVREKVSSFTTQHPCCAPRVTNIHRIADIVDGYVVKPGETFSLNGLVGKRDKARGFVEAPMILNGRFVNDVGGGVSQFATTMFNAVFFGGFQDVQHTAHSFYISRYPAGRESTVSFPQPDFRWRNDSPHGVLIKASYTGTSITVDFWSTKRYDIESQSSGRYAVKSFPTLSESGPDCIPMGGVEGFSIDVWRIFKKDGEVVRRQKFHTVYLPEPRLTCEPESEEDGSVSPAGGPSRGRSSLAPGRSR